MEIDQIKFFKLRLMFFFILIFNQTTWGQNLINNGGFEEVECPGNPINSFTISEYWYGAGSDAYWNHLDCPFDPAVVQSIAAIDTELLPNSGEGYVSLEGTVLWNGFFIAEGLGATLDDPLKANRHYYMDMAYLYFPRIASPDNMHVNCEPIPEQILSIYTSDTLLYGTYITENSPMGNFPVPIDASFNGKIQMEIKGSEVNNFEEKKWYPYWDCFLADGSETNLAIIGKNYKTGVPDSCFAEESNWSLYYYGFAIDDIRLLLLPERLDTLIALCDQKAALDLNDLIAEPVFSKASFLWDDGSTATSRVFQEEGIYEGIMILPCTNIPISVEVAEELCLVNVFVPNAFSPNYDGINDELSPFIDAKLPLGYYQFSVYDRWGSLVFYTDNPQISWDGSFQSDQLDQGVFTWLLEYSIIDGRNINKVVAGEVLLVR